MDNRDDFENGIPEPSNQEESALKEDPQAENVENAANSQIDVLDTSEEVVVVPQKGRFVADILDYIEIFVCAISFVLLIFSFGFRLCTVNGPSMQNTLFAGERLIVSEMFYTPQRGDIVVFHETGNSNERLNEALVKRVIATEGEKVDIDYRTWTVTVTDVSGNKIVLDEPYRKLEGYAVRNYPTSFIVPEGCLFVMGDNRNNSTDSRSSELGFIDNRKVLGKVILRVTPFSRFGTVD